jgi:hypothetical protein
MKGGNYKIILLIQKVITVKNPGPEDQALISQG